MAFKPKKMIEFRTRGRFFKAEGITEEMVRVDTDGSVSVWDSVAGHFTLVHSLSEPGKTRIRNKAKALCG